MRAFLRGIARVDFKCAEERRQRPEVIATGHPDRAGGDRRTGLPLAILGGALAHLARLEQCCGDHDENRGGDGADAFGERDGALELQQAPDGFAGAHEREMRLEFRRRLVAEHHVVGAGLEDDGVPFRKRAVGFIHQGAVGRPGEFLAVKAGADFVKHLAQAVDVRRRSAGAFGRDEAGRADVGGVGADVRDQPDVGELGPAVDEDDVLRLDVAMDEFVLVEKVERAGQRDANGQTVLQGNSSVLRRLLGQRRGHVGIRLNRLAAHGVIGQFHDVVEVAGLVVALDLENVHEAFMGAGERLEVLDALVLALVRAVLLEAAAVDDLDRAIGAHRVDRQPDSSVAPFANRAEQAMCGYIDRSLLGRSPGAAVANRRCVIHAMASANFRACLKRWGRHLVCRFGRHPAASNTGHGCPVNRQAGSLTHILRQALISPSTAWPRGRRARARRWSSRPSGGRNRRAGTHG